jgi:hypothetical protein
MGVDFVLLAYCTALDVVSDPYVHSGPLIYCLGLPDGFVSSGMSR